MLGPVAWSDVLVRVTCNGGLLVKCLSRLYEIEFLMVPFQLWSKFCFFVFFFLWYPKKEWGKKLGSGNVVFTLIWYWVSGGTLELFYNCTINHSLKGSCDVIFPFLFLGNFLSDLPNLKDWSFFFFWRVALCFFNSISNHKILPKGKLHLQFSLLLEGFCLPVHFSVFRKKEKKNLFGTQ